mmetsp:Transcript_11480/g.17659  ORF Transcript_11480/g.17659 Transcript_11480/m.17659 type:complete len:112 (+) Transcript_11480:136-471(+)
MTQTDDPQPRLHQYLKLLQPKKNSFLCYDSPDAWVCPNICSSCATIWEVQSSHLGVHPCKLGDTCVCNQHNVSCASAQASFSLHCCLEFARTRLPHRGPKPSQERSQHGAW